MTTSVSAQLKGMDDVFRRIQSLKEEAGRDVLAGSAKKAMTIVRDDAAARAQRLDDPTTPANIALNIRMLEDKQFYEETGSVKISVGVRRGRGPGLNTWYWYYQEFGTSSTRAHPFMRPALKENLQEVFQAFLKSAKYRLTRKGVI